MAKDIDVNLKLNAINTEEVQRKIKELTDSLDKYQQASNSFDKSLNKSNGNVGNGNSAQSMFDSAKISVDISNELKSTLSDILQAQHGMSNGNSQVSTQQMDSLNRVASQITGVFSSSQSVGLNPFSSQGSQFNNPNYAKAQDYLQRGSLTRPSTPNGTAEERLNSLSSRNQDRQQYNSFRDEINKLTAMGNNTERTVNTASSHHTISYERNQALSGRFDEAGQRISSLYHVDGEGNTSGSLAEARESLVNRQNQEYESRNSSTQNTSEWNQHDKEAEQIGKVIQQYDSLINKIQQTSTTFDKAKDDLNSGLSSGNISEQAKRGSFGDILSTRSFAIAANTMNGISSSVGNSMSSGNNARLQSSNSIDAITLANGANGVDNNSDNHLLNRLATLGVRNGTGYSATDMSQFASTYSQNSGNTNVYADQSVANNMSQLSRFENFGTGTTNQLYSSLGAMGALNTAGQSTNLTNSIASEIAGSNMQGRAGQQGQALSSIYGNLLASGHTLNNSQAVGIAGFQGAMASTGNRALQGASGATAYNQLANGISSNMSNPAVRMAFGGNNPSYAGMEGQARLDMDMNEAGEHPEKFSGMIQNLKRTYGANNSTITADTLMKQFGMSAEAARGFVKASDDGTLNSRSYNRLASKYSGQLGTLQKQYSSQGDSTLTNQQANEQRANISGSEALDGVRNARNTAGSNMSGIATLGGNVLGGVVTGVASSMGSVLGASVLKGGGGKILKGTKLGSLFGLGKGAKDVASAADKTEGVVEGASGLSGLFGKGVTSAKGLIGRGVTATKGLLSKGAGKLGLEGLSKFGLKGAEKVGLKGAEKVGSKFIPGVGWAMAGIDAVRGVGDIAKDPANALRHPIKSVGSILGLTRVNANEKSNSDSKGKDRANNKSERVLDHADKWLVDFNRTLDRADRLITNAKGIKLGTGSKSSKANSTDDSDDGKLSGSASKKAKQLASMIKKKYPKANSNGIAAVLGNWQQESGFDPTAVNSSGATGLGQWLGGRADALKAYAKKKGKSWKDPGLQVDFALNGDGSNSKILKQVLSGSGSVDSLTADYYNKWERPGASDKTLQTRKDNANKLAKHATGMIAMQPEAGVISEEYPEAVLPLDPSRANNSRSILQNANRILGNTISSPNSNTANNSTFSPSYSVSIGNVSGSEQDVQGLKVQLQEVLSKVASHAQQQSNQRQMNFYSKNFKRI